MTTDTILSLIDQRLSKAHLDGNGQAAMALNELRERIVAGPNHVADLVQRVKDLQAEVSRAWGCEQYKTVVIAMMEGNQEEFRQRIQEQAAQLCAVRAAAGMQTGTIEELCQRIEAMRQDSDTWETMLRIVRANGFESVGQVLARVDHFRTALLRIHVCGDSTEHRIAREALGV